MEAQELKERLEEIEERNQRAKPESCQGTMPKGLEEAFNNFMRAYGEKWAISAMEAVLEVKSIEPALSGSFCEGFWLGHDYALEYGQLRGN